MQVVVIKVFKLVSILGVVEDLTDQSASRAFAMDLQAQNFLPKVGVSTAALN